MLCTIPPSLTARSHIRVQRCDIVVVQCATWMKSSGSWRRSLHSGTSHPTSTSSAAQRVRQRGRQHVARSNSSMVSRHTMALHPPSDLSDRSTGWCCLRGITKRMRGRRSRRPPSHPPLSRTVTRSAVLHWLPRPPCPLLGCDRTSASCTASRVTLNPIVRSTARRRPSASARPRGALRGQSVLLRQPQVFQLPGVLAVAVLHPSPSVSERCEVPSRTPRRR